MNGKRRGLGGWTYAFLLGWILATAQAEAQLAITEVMSSASSGANTDFWELTNFGEEDIDLSGYRWSDDNDSFGTADVETLNGITIAAGESVLLVEQRFAGAIPDAASFRAWWGERLPPSTRIFFYTGNGLAGGGDEVRLWGPSAVSDEDLVDRAAFGRARPGSTFTYDPGTGVFGLYSIAEENGAFRSSMHDDIGSPGIVAGQVAAHILEDPIDVETCAGVDVAFSVLAGGFPRPRYQWFFDDMMLQEETDSVLIVSNAQAANVGRYFVDVQGSTNRVRSQVAILTVDNNLQRPRLLGSFPDVQVISNETARFFAIVCANPPPAYQWRTNGVAVPGATNRAFAIANASPAWTGMPVCVEVWNTLGTTNACARLSVIPKPRLLITEVMAAHAIDCGASSDWFELTNVGTNVVDLFGFRFKTGKGFPPSTNGARVITNHLVLKPAESAVLVRGLDISSFVAWWGEEALPSEPKLFAYTGVGLRASSDQLYVWTPGEDNPNAFLTLVAWEGPVPGVSLFYTNNGDFAIPMDSVAGVGGAIGAASCTGIGSPGYITNPPPRFSRIVRGAEGPVLRWRAISNATYRVWFKSDFQTDGWQSGPAVTATNWVETWSDSWFPSRPRRFYLLEQLQAHP